MSTEEPIQTHDPTQDDAAMQDAALATSGGDGAKAQRKRPRLDLAVDSRERKRGKTMFGLVLGTLNRAKNEDKARNASDAAKKRQLIEQRLQDKLKKETDSVRKAEEAKKDKTTANRKEEELQLKDSIHKLRRARLPLLANFLSTSDVIPSEEDLSSTPPPATDPLAPPSRTHPPPVYYLPAILLPFQEAFLKRRKAEVKEAAEKEWATFHEERKEGIEEITQLRQRVVEEESRKKTEREAERTANLSTSTTGGDVKMGDDEAGAEADDAPSKANPPSGDGEAPTDPPVQAKDMEVDDEGGTDGSKTLESDSTKGSSSKTVPPSAGAAPASSETKDDAGGLMRADEDDAVEY